MAGDGKTEKEEREARLAEELRKNLRRRKQASKAVKEKNRKDA
ncbi:hypothetical protein [Euryhalocaulis caribicus]|nr:hypothetical protein [Euryhalocaulis caribicus]